MSMEGDVEVVCDADQLGRMVQNLVINAQQAIGEGIGAVRIEVSFNPLVVVIADTGPGMEEEVVQRMFEPRFTTRGGGSGLGLSIVKAIADRHGIEVQCDTGLGKGTAFFLRFVA